MTVRGWARCLIVAILSIMAASQAQADEGVAKGPAPDWVELVDVPEPNPAREREVRGGIYYLLSDEQVRHRQGGHFSFKRYVRKIVDRPGLENGASVVLNFDPARHKVTLNRLRILRDDTVLDRLAEATFEIFRQETEAEKGIYDGRLTAHINLTDVRVGDVIDYAATYETTPVVAPDLFYDVYFTEWNSPVGLLREKVMWPSDRPLQIRRHGTDIEPAITFEDGMTSHVWESVDPDPVRHEEHMPAGHSVVGWVEISSASTWQDVVNSLKPHFKPASSLPEGFTAKLDEIARQHDDPGRRMTAALRLVQDEIRYVSLAMGAGSYIPRPPATVIESGFGDCKDKALLLVSALGHLGIEARVALTDLDKGRGLDVRLPALKIFDHAIVVATIGERTYWLDPTDYLQGGISDMLVPPDYGHALPLSDANASLERIERPVPREPTIFTDEAFAFPTEEGEALKLVVRTVYRGEDADAMRRRLASRPLKSFADAYVDYYNSRYPGIAQTADIQVSDDREFNVLSTVEHYELDWEALHADDLIKEFPIRADLDLDKLPRPSSVARKAPVFIGAQVSRRHRVRVSNLKAEFRGPEVDIDTPYFGLVTSWKSSKHAYAGTFEVNWLFQTRAETVPAPELANYLKSVEEARQNGEWYYDFAYSEPKAPMEALTGLKNPEGDEAGLHLIAFLVAAAAVLITLIALAITDARRDFTAQGQRYWPVSNTKFLLAGLASAGLYQLFCIWRGLRQERADGANIWPFWRTVFLFVWYLPIFLSANRRLGKRALPAWLGITGALAYLAPAVADAFGVPSVLDIPPYAIGIAIQALPCVAIMPLGMAINRLNRDAPEIIVRNSRLSMRDMLIVGTGTGLYVLVLLAPVT